MSTPPLSCRPAVLLSVLLLLATACSAPRAIIGTGKVTPKGEFRIAYNQGFNIATAPIGKAGSALRDAARRLADKDTVGYSASLNNLQAAAIAYLLDPVQPTADLGLRYGLAPRFDVGYKYAFGSHVFDAQYQFMGTTGTPEAPDRSATSGTTYGSVGLQFATQRQGLPSLPFLSDITDKLSFSGRRHDLLIPFTFSQSFGAEEEVGAFSYGLVYAHSWVSYGFAPTDVYLPNNVRLPELPQQSRNFSSFGGFANLKLGYRYAYVVAGLSIFYQNYGTYQLLNGASTSLSGLTFVPSLGLQARIPSFK